MDKEKVLRDIREIIKDCREADIEEADYVDVDLLEDVLTIIKEQAEHIELMKMVYGSDMKYVSELVRCKDCKYRYTGLCSDYMADHGEDGVYNSLVDDWYCADGERKQEANLDVVIEGIKKMDEKRSSKQYYAEAYYRYKKAMDEFQQIINKIIESGDGVELNRLASAIESNVDDFVYEK